MSLVNNIVLSRLMSDVGAQGFSKVVQIVIRLAAIPILLNLWEINLYGEWLMVAAIPTFLAIGDGGFTSAGWEHRACPGLQLSLYV